MLDRTISARNLIALAGAIAALFALSACNPITTESPMAGYSTGYKYTGPGDAIIEIYVTGAAGYSVDYRPAIIWAGPPAGECFNGVTAAPELCWTGGGDYLSVKDAHTQTSETWWPTMVMHPGASFRVFTRCNGSNTNCPAGTTYHVRAVDRSGHLIGDLT